MKLSIITINLNNCSGLQKTIQSVVSQTFSDYEFIIIDGGSTDESINVIKQFTDKITYWISEPDKGIYNAMNKGIQQAKGEYCYFLNSGDTLYSETVLETIFSGNYPEDIIIGSYVEVYNDKTLVRKGRAYIREKEGTGISLHDLLNGAILHQATFIRKKLFEQYGLYDENYRIVSDWKFFMITIGLGGVQSKYIDVIVVHFGMDGISSGNRTLFLKEKNEVVENLIPQSILTDYERYRKLELDFHNLTNHKVSYNLARFINKSATLYEIIKRKIIRQKEDWDRAF